MLSGENGNGNNHFRRFNLLVIDTNVHMVGVAHRLLRLVASNLQHLKFICRIAGRYTDSSSDSNRKRRHFKLIDQFCADNVRTFEIGDADDQLPVGTGLSTNLFRNIHELRINGNQRLINHNLRQRINLQTLCPNLVKLWISNDFAMYQGFLTYWPSLQAVSMEKSQRNSHTLHRLTELNPQLKAVKFLNCCPDHIHRISSSLPNIEKMAVNMAISIARSTDFNPLKNLNCLTLTNMWLISIDEILEGVSQLTQLHILKLGRHFRSAYSEHILIKMVQ